MNLIPKFLRRTQPKNLGGFVNHPDSQLATRGLDPKYLLKNYYRPGVEPEVAEKVSTVYHCVNLISGSIAQMQCEVRNRNKVNQDIPNDHQFERLWNIEPCPQFSGPQMVEWIVRRMLLYGNAFVHIEWKAGRPYMLTPIPNSCVDVQYSHNTNGNEYSITGHPYSRLNKMWDQESILHFTTSTFDGCYGKSVLEMGASRAIDIEMLQTAYVENRYVGGMLSNIAFKDPEAEMSKEQVMEFKKKIAEENSTGVAGQNQYIVLQGLDIVELPLPTKDMQLLESRNFQTTDILRAFSIPSMFGNQETKQTSWGSGVGTMYAFLNSFTLQRHVNRIKAEINRKIFNGKPEYVEFLTDNLLRGSIKERNENYKMSLGGGPNPGWRSVNEIRRREGDSPLEDPIYDEVYHPSLHGQNNTEEVEEDINIDVSREEDDG